MCGIFGTFSEGVIDSKKLVSLGSHARQRGRDSSGLYIQEKNRARIIRADFDLSKLLRRTSVASANCVIGHSRLITQGHLDNQPVLRERVVVFHNGIVTNADDLWEKIGKKPELEIDSEILAAYAATLLESGLSPEKACDELVEACTGVVSAIFLFLDLDQLVLVSNNGSLYEGIAGADKFFSSERFPLEKIGCDNVRQVFRAKSYHLKETLASEPQLQNFSVERPNLVPKSVSGLRKHSLLDYEELNLARCSRCVLPETMPFIEFDSEMVCNYCRNYVSRLGVAPLDEFRDRIDRFKSHGRPDCIIPFSGGRDSSFGLHAAVLELGLRPIAYTYDWGMVTDLGRRNISRMCSALGVENIIVAADVAKKRMHIRKNLEAWLDSPHLGMVSILTAGDKHFFRHVETVRRQTRVSLQLWSINPLEITHFKTGFLGIPPEFANGSVYTTGIRKQLRYQTKRFRAMLQSPRYFNSSIPDTISGEYFRSRQRKTDYFHFFDYWRWDEKEIESVLENYGWEKAEDTDTTWRIGDGTAAFYNYVYHRVAGFTEHDTFRSNQIREGSLSRDEALALIQRENRPRYQNIKWYLDVLGLDFYTVINRVNSIPRLGA